LAEEWRLILANAAPGAKVLLRSASFQPDFLPAFVLEKMRLDPQAAAAEHAKDRVGTYASTLIGTIQP
jgi:S-adenosylmethionine-diacylglycerol 3-amino-3-carboxypropyl transferase